MRFPQLPIGQRFTYQGRLYTKTGPLTASEEGSGTQRMIPRAAEVTPEAGAKAREKPVRQHYSREEVGQLCDDFKRRLVERLRDQAAGSDVLSLEGTLGLIEALPFEA